MAFYENFRRLCDTRGESPTFVVNQIGLSTPNATYWKNGSMPKDDTLRKLADYFGVTVRALTDSTEELRDEQRQIFIERCKDLDESLEDSDKVLTFGDADYLKKIIDGRITSTVDCVEALAAELGISVAYLFGLADSPLALEKVNASGAEEIDVILTTLHLRKLIEDDLHLQCSFADAEVIANVIFDFVGSNKLIPLGWAIDSIGSDTDGIFNANFRMWKSMFSTFLDYHYEHGGRLNRLRTIAADKDAFISPALFEKKGQKNYYCIVSTDGDTVLSRGDMTLDEVELFLINYDPNKKSPQAIKPETE